ncbi:STAS/SEC14 domain-containing protein [Hymenobacter taeanensis]|uniref:STAS/SEC14 domain-containing protein n=1 Tax=Hymenobacter taeanensis TaxID=2735321 RepID=A0A6M6BKX5_9BACT|nr:MULTISPECIES: STAS/SEC14 domain-containing protein [Hymenobacter]QJX48766.1 STAS/SEC14 domain-containing protein [Hymenobacter taeanensis]UOQ81729.1 STAS/SEC14 domain-containing protein [Hymenobacter sp. 5414T-23]
MPIELTNGFGKVYLTIEYDAANRWVYNNWIGYQTFTGIIAGADACLFPLSENKCAYLLNDNRQVLGPWNHAVEWIATQWAPRAIEQGLTHFAHIVSPESMAAQSAESMFLGIGQRLEMRMFSDIEQAKAWLREAQQAARR